MTPCKNAPPIGDVYCGEANRNNAVRVLWAFVFGRATYYVICLPPSWASALPHVLALFGSVFVWWIDVIHKSAYSSRAFYSRVCFYDHTRHAHWALYYTQLLQKNQCF